MFKLHGFIVLTLATSLAHAADPFPQGDPVAGKALVEKNCVSCHAGMLGGDGSKIYTRPDHKVKSASALLAQVRSCNTNLDVKMFEDEELNVASYLNKTYYKFDK